MIVIYQKQLTNFDIDDICLNVLKKKLDDLEDFEKTIINYVIVNINSLIEFVDAVLDNWSFDRLGFVERSIILCALAEKNTKLNDKKIVINEAIEIAKLYCDDESFKLINGILDI